MQFDYVCTSMCVFVSHALNGICVCFQGSAGPPGPQGPRGLTGQKGSKGDSVCFFLPLFIYIVCKLFCLSAFCKMCALLVHECISLTWPVRGIVLQGESIEGKPGPQGNTGDPGDRV